MPEMSSPDTSVTTAEAPPARTPFVERLSDSLQNVVKALIGSNRRPPRRFRSLLNGTYLGHPLHPVVTDIPIGAWTVAVVLDIIWLVSPTANAWAANAAFGAVAVGFLASLIAFASGWTDWSDTYGSERTVGIYHGLLMTSAIILYLISGVLRLTDSAHDTVAAAVLAFAGYVVVAIAGYLGGDMVYAKGTNVNHTAWEFGGEDYEAVLPVKDVADNKMYRVTVSGVPVVLVSLGGKYSAISSTCTHAGGPLDEGELQKGGVVQCPWHGSRFELRSGRVLTGPATIAQPRYDVRVRDGMIELKRIGGH
jgi:nitrite reductase/ring-hydroxylating ferredoxin subunit/uncharacterized membrane protein